MALARARLVVVTWFALAALAAAVYWIRLGVPVDVVAAPTGRIACVSYAPYRKAGESPFTKGYMVDVARIDEDMKALSRRFDCVRTYSVGQGLDRVPEVAARYGMKVLLGAWLSRDPLENAEELGLAIQVANAHRDTIRAIVVGNEVLLRGELPQRTIAEHLRMVKTATGLPVTYADVWEFWVKYKEVAPAVDFLTIHILPYWEDEPVPIDEAIPHVDKIYKYMQSVFPGREFLIGETGWPSEGRQRWRSVPSRVNEARFFREFMAFVAERHLPYNVIEAFDQAWKRKLEGTVGGYWGLYDDELNDKFALSGPVVEEPRWWLGLVVGCAVALAWTLYAYVAVRSRRWGALGARSALGFFVGAMAAAEARHLVFANQDALEWASTVVALLAAVAAALVVGERVARWLEAQGHDAETIACAPLVVAWSRRTAAPAAARLRGALLSFWLVLAAVVNLLLVFDSRYRDFPTLLFAPVVVAFVALAVTRGAVLWRAPREIEERLLVAALAAAAALIVVMELPINASADLWAALCLAFAGAAWISVGPTGRTSDRIAAGPASASPP
jgi:exo-beta-1,3-glucanase (GH17 family)